MPQTDLNDLLGQTDAQLQQLIQPSPLAPPVDSRLAELQKRLPAIDRQLAYTGVTRYDLWIDYRGEQPNGYQYTQFCYHYRQWHQTQQLTMHLEHKAGDKVFVNFAGKRLAIVDQASGELKPVEFFVAVLRCSQLTYAQAIASQQTEDFIEALQNALCYFGGVPAPIVPDNLKAALIRADCYEPQINEMLSDFALHYQTTILPARSGKPRDKALVEGAVNILYSRVYAPLRNQVFHRLDGLNTAIRERIDAHNQMLFSGKEYSRRTRFEAYEQGHLKPLPTSIYQIKHHLVARITLGRQALLQCSLSLRWQASSTHLHAEHR